MTVFLAISVLLPSIILLEDDRLAMMIFQFLVLLPSIILLEDDRYLEQESVA